MKKKRPSKKVVLTVSGLAALCLIVLAGAWILNREPKNDFIPAPGQNGDTAESWTENELPSSEIPSSASDNTEAPATPPAVSAEKETIPTSQTQTILSEEESGVTSDLSGSISREEEAADAPAEKPSATGDSSNPDIHPEYDSPASEATQPPASLPDSGATTPVPAESSAPDSSSGSVEEPAESVPAADSDHAGQVYDPVFGWITVGPTHQDSVDSTGDINKQVGTMGGG
ncbi:MAG TPA: hypothetical protein H9761_05855 [Candidatus Eisenbergiella merdavium]|uniref:Uncharacterized protein n=1 Tax=Candidatus Eisenbergiella merdavium TaxID=2838551 RepID=A0A9D2NEA6_9FIRM|nr:hypothetical protein [Candidatus Eisenbergiella merdavium]